MPCRPLSRACRSWSFAPTDLLLHLALHLAVKHRFEDAGLRGCLDMAAVCQQHGDAVQWADFASRATRWSVSGGVRAALELAAECTGARHARRRAGIAGRGAVGCRHHGLGPPQALPSDLGRASFQGVGLGDAGRSGRQTGRSSRHASPDSPWRTSIACRRRRGGSSRTTRCDGGTCSARHRSAVWQIIRRDTAFLADAHREARLRDTPRTELNRRARWTVVPSWYDCPGAWLRQRAVCPTRHNLLPAS